MAKNIDYLLTGKIQNTMKTLQNPKKKTEEENQTTKAQTKTSAPSVLSMVTQTAKTKAEMKNNASLLPTASEKAKQYQDIQKRWNEFQTAERLATQGAQNATRSGVAATVRDFNSMYNLGMLSTTNKSLMNRSQLEELLETQKAQTEEAKEKQDAFKLWTDEQKQQKWDEAQKARETASRLSYIADNGLPVYNYNGMISSIGDETWRSGNIPNHEDERIYGRPEDYYDNRFDYDSILYDTIYGDGAFEARQLAEDYDSDIFHDELDQLWDSLENKKLYSTANEAKKQADDLEFESVGNFGYDKYYEAQKSTEEALANLTDIEQWQMHAPTAASGEYNPDAVKASKAKTYGWVGLIYGDQTDVHGNETDEIYYFANNLPTGDMSELEQYNSLKAAMMMSDEQRDTFNRYYNHGMYKEAQAYYDALKPYLNAALTTTRAMYEKDMSTNENAWNMIIRRVFTGPAAGVAGAIGTVAALFGDKTAKDPNSEYWQPTATNASIVAARAAQYGEVFANVFGENGRKYGELIGNALYSIADNVVATVLTAGTGAAIGKTMADKFSRGMLQFVMSTEATAGAMKERLDNGQDPTQAALFALGSGVVEAITEKYSIEALFNMDFNGLLRDKNRFLSYVGKNFFVEGTEEVAADLLNNVWDGAVSLFTDSTPEMMREYEALAAQYGPEEARRMVIDNFKEKLFDSFLAGGFSGLIMSSGYAGINAGMEYVQDKEIGRNVREYNLPTNATTEERSKQETENIRRLITTAGKMQTNSKSKQQADAMQAKLDDGKKVTNVEIANLTRSIVEESGEKVGEAVNIVLKSRIQQDLESNGASKRNAKNWAGFVTKAVLTSQAKTKQLMETEQGQIARELIKDDIRKSGATAGLNEESVNKLAEMGAVISLGMGVRTKTAAAIVSHVSVRDTLLDYAKNTELQDIAGKAVTEIKEQNAIQDKIGEILTGDVRKATNAVSSITKDAKTVSKMDLLMAKGKRTNSATEAVYDGQIVDVKGILTKVEEVEDEVTGKKQKQSVAYAVLADGSTVRAGDVQAVNPEAAKLLQYSTMRTNSAINDRVMSVLFKNAASIKDADSAIADAAKVTVRTVLGKETGDTRLGATLQEQVEKAALEDFNEAEQKRAEGRREIKPGQGIAMFNGEKIGTEAFKAEVAKLKDKAARRDAYIIGELAQSAGFDVEFYYDPEDNGNYGQYSGKNGVRINLAAVRDTETGMRQSALAIFAHEITHWLEANSPEEYRKLRSFVINRMEMQGVNVEQRLQNVIKGWRASGDAKIDLYGAVAEMVANGCDQILTNRKVVTELRESDPTLFGKVQSVVRNLINRMKAALGDLQMSTSYESRNMTAYMDELSDLWLGAFREAKGTKGTAAESSEVQNSIREDLDQKYADAVEREDWRTAENMLLEKMQQTAGITGYRAPNFYNGEHKTIAKMIKENYGDAVARAVEDMAPMVPENAVLIPMPPHEGKVLEDTDTMILAKALGEATGMPVVVALESDPHTSRNVAKMTGDRTVTADSMGFRQIAEIPEGSMPVFVDNMVGGGTTAMAAKNAIGRGITLAYAQSARSKSAGVKEVSVTFDKNHVLIPYSQRMDPNNKSYKYSFREASSVNALDAEYEDAVKNNDAETQEMLVSEAAANAGYNVEGYHGTDAKFTVFKKGDIGFHIGSIEQATDRIKQAGMRSWQNNKENHVMHLFAKLENPLVIDHDFGDWHGKNVAEMLLETEQFEEGFDENAEKINAKLREIAAMPDGAYTDKVLREYLQSLGYDGIDYENQFENVDRDEYGWAEDFDRSYIVFDANQIKSADPVVYDDDGYVIPLSERFNQESKDIRYSMREIDDAYMQAVEDNDMETAQRMVDEKANNYLNNLLLPDDSDEEGFKYHRGPAPTKTFKRYAVLNVSPDGFRAAYAGNKNPTPLGVWLDAQNLQSYLSDKTQFEDGTFATYIPGDTGFDVNDKFSKEQQEKLGLPRGKRWLLERGGKHSSDVPNFSQMNLKKDENGNPVTNNKRDGALPHNKLIFEIEYGISDEGDLTEYVKEHGRIAKGGKNQGLAKIQPNQYYDFKTNPNAVGNWGIGGTFRIIRLVPHEEVVSVTNQYKQDAIDNAKKAYSNGEISKEDMKAQIKNAEAIQIQKWIGGYHPEDFGLNVDNVDEMVRNGYKMKLTDPVTYDDQGNVIPLSERFNEKENDIRYSMREIDDAYMQAVEDGDEAEQQRIVDEAAQAAGYTDKAYHGTMLFGFTKFKMSDGRGTVFVAYDKYLASSYMRAEPETRRIIDRNGVPFNPYTLKDEDLIRKYIKINNGKYLGEEIYGIELAYKDKNRDKDEFVIKHAPFLKDQETETNITRQQMQRELAEWQNPNGEFDGIYELYTKPGKQLVIDAEGNDWNEITIPDDNQIAKDIEHYIGDKASGGFAKGIRGHYYTTRQIAEFAKAEGYDSVRINNVYDNGGRNWQLDEEDALGDIGIFFNPSDVKSADPVVYDDDANVIKPSERFNAEEEDIRYSVREKEEAYNKEMDEAAHPANVQFSVRQLAEANGLRFDEDELKLYDAEGNEIDGIKNKVTVEMIENTPAGRLINMARDGYKAKNAKEAKFKPTISAETAQKQKQMLADLSNMIAQYKDSNLVWEIAGSMMYSALKKNSDTQYTTTVDFGTICSKTQEIINVMSDVMLKRGRGLTREEVLEVYKQTAAAGLTVPCPVCYVFSRWMGVPSLLNQMNEYQKRFVKTNPDGSVNRTATQAAVTKYLNSAMKQYGNKKNLDKAKTQLLNQLKTREDTRSEMLAVMMGKNATAEEKLKAKEKHDKAIKEMDELQKELGKIEAYNWVTQALCKETKKGSGKYVVDPEFVPTPESVLFDLRKTGEFAAKYAKNWKYRNTRGAGMGKAIMPYSGESLGDVIYGTERKSADMNAFFKYNAGKASTAIKNAIKRARAQNLLGGQRLQSTSDYRPEWGLDYIMTFLELQAIGSKVQMYTKVAEAVDLLASMGADINLSIMGAGSGYHIATAEEIRRAKTDKELRSRMGTTFDENGETHTYVLDFSDVTGMDYNTAKALKNKHNSVQMILVGMDDVHIRLAMANDDIDFIIPWHASGNSKDVLSSMMKAVGQQLDASHNFEDTQRDIVSANQTARQKKLWEIRVKILMGTALTAEEKKIVEKDSWLLDLFGRFNTKGIDDDCYKVQLGKDQAEQIFPFEYWNKSLKKADADKNGRRFVEYCEHFGIVPRFSQFADEHGYWKVLIDRPMYDNDGNYRDQQVVDVTKAKVGRMENRQLVDSDMPLTTSAMYGPNYSTEEKNATDNTLAALKERDDLRAMGSNVLEEEPAARNNQSAFAAARTAPVIEQTETEAQEEVPAKKRRVMTVDEDVEHSYREEMDFHVRQWLDSINVNSLRTEAERMLVSEYRDLEISIRLDMERERNIKQQIAEIEKTPEGDRSNDQKRTLQKLKVRLENVERVKESKQKKMVAVTGKKGFGKLMQEQNRIYNDNIYGRTQAEVNDIVIGMEEKARRIEERVQKAKAVAEELEKSNTIQQVKKILGATTADMAVAELKKKFNSNWTKKELRTFFDPVLVKMNAGEDFSNEVQELADVLVRSNQELVYEGLSALQGLTITIGKGQQQELKAKGSNLNEIRDRLAGTGIKVRYGNYSSLEGDVKDIRAEFPGMPELGDEKDSLENFVSWVEGMKTRLGVDEYYSDYLAEAMAAVMEIAARTASDSGLYVPKDAKARKQITDLVDYIRSLKTRTETAEKSLTEISDLMRQIREAGERATAMSGVVTNNMAEALKYYDTIAKLAMEEAKKQKQSAIIEQLKSDHAKKILKINESWRNMLERNDEAYKQAEENRKERGKINTAVKRMYHLLKDQTTQKNMPEYMKALARYTIKKIIWNDAFGLGAALTKADKEQLAEAMRLLAAWEEQDGPAEYTQVMDGLNSAEEVVALNIIQDMTILEGALQEYNGKIRGKNHLDTLQKRGVVLKTISEAVGEIYSAIQAEREVQANGRKIKTENQAFKVRQATKNRKFAERTGRAGRAIAGFRKAIISGNMTPEYFFRLIGNEGLNDLWENYHEAENRNGLELEKAQARLKEIADKHGYKNWDTNKKVTIKLGGKNIEMTVGQLMSLYATWKREQQLGPAMSEHLTKGGFFVEKDLRDGILGKQVMEKKAHRISNNPDGGDVDADGNVPAIENALTKEQKEFVDEVVGYMSSDLSEMGNEASMIAYGIKLYKEKYYFPFQIWDGVKNRKSNDAGQGANADRAFHPSFAKSRLHGANNALIMGDFMQTAADHIAGMINYATIGLANESLQKVLNCQLEEGGETPEGYDINDVTKRNTRAVLEEAYGQEALQYLLELQKQLNGGAVRTSKSLGDKAISLFRKNAVAGSLSVAAQQPLSYIRAAMMINPKYLAAALNAKYWKGSYKEMMEHSGVAVIKDMGRFDVNFGQSAREYLKPEGKETKAQKVWGQVTEKATILPELMDRATWTRMWSAVKLEQHAEHPEMDIRSDEFLDLCGKRFNEVMRRTQVYDSMLVKSANMRSDNYWVKSLTSFMAEPTLTANVLADAVRSARAGEAGGKALLAKAGAAFLMSAVLQAAVKAMFSTGRTPDEKKTWFENLMYRFGNNIVSEADPMQLIPGYGDLVTLLKEGKLSDDAMGALGKLFDAGESTINLVLGKGWEDPYKAIENSVGQLTQIITDLPAKNIMRDMRAVYNWLIGHPYADRESNANVINKQWWESFYNADNLLGVLNDALGDAGYKATNTAYYKRIYEAQKAGDEAKAQSIIDYLIYGKGVKEKTIKTGVNKAKKEAEAGAEEEE